MLRFPPPVVRSPLLQLVELAISPEEPQRIPEFGNEHLENNNDFTLFFLNISVDCVVFLLSAHLLYKTEEKFDRGKQITQWKPSSTRNAEIESERSTVVVRLSSIATLLKYSTGQLWKDHYTNKIFR